MSGEGHSSPQIFVQHVLQQEYGSLPSTALFAGTDCCIVRDCSWLESHFFGFVQQKKGMLPFRSLFTCTNDRILGDDVCLHSMFATQLFEKKNSYLPLAGFFACAKDRVVGNDGGSDGCGISIFQQNQGNLPLLRLSTGTYGAVVSNNICFHQMKVNFTEQKQCVLPSSSLLTGT